MQRIILVLHKFKENNYNNTLLICKYTLLSFVNKANSFLSRDIYIIITSIITFIYIIIIMQVYQITWFKPV